MLADWGSRDEEFLAMTAELRRKLLRIARADDRYDCVPMQGSGTYSVESMLGTFVSGDDKVLVLSNGAYGKRACSILQRTGRAHSVVDKGEFLPPRAADVESALAKDPSVTHVFVVHCETTTGILNPIGEIAEAASGAGRKLLIDSMSAFGAIPVDAGALRFQAMVSSSNKCFESVPGFGYIIAEKASLAAAEGNCHSVSLDASAQWIGLNRNGQWRFTPPTHSVAAFVAALRAHDAEGGVAGRCRRYSRNRDVIVSGLRNLGFETLLDDSWMAPIIATFLTPADDAFDFERLYRQMKASGFVIYPGKLTEIDTFRIGCIGHIDEHVMRAALAVMTQALREMGLKSGAPPAAAESRRAALEAA